MVQPVLRACLEGVFLEYPAVKRNRDTKLVFFIALALQGGESQNLAAGQIEKRTSRSQQRRRLIKVTVKAMKNPVQPRNPDRSAEARVRGVLCDSRLRSNTWAAEMRFAEPGDQC